MKEPVGKFSSGIGLVAEGPSAPLKKTGWDASKYRADFGAICGLLISSMQDLVF